ncbi:MAG: protocatechuate 3,4-dioxygenase subunit alpha [Jannaschia sp.]
MTIRRESPSQTAGPYVQIGLTPNAAGIDGVFAEDLGSGPVKAEGPRIAVSGRILDGAGAAMPDAVVEVWQADADGSYTPGIWRRILPDADGVWRLESVRPGAVTCGDGAVMAPHLNLWIVARGINLGLGTRTYFPEDAVAQAVDPVLVAVPEDRRGTLVARATGEGAYVFDIHLQGAAETVFLDI